MFNIFSYPNLICIDNYKVAFHGLFSKHWHQHGSLWALHHNPLWFSQSRSLCTSYFLPALKFPRSLFLIQLTLVAFLSIPALSCWFAGTRQVRISRSSALTLILTHRAGNLGSLAQKTRLSSERQSVSVMPCYHTGTSSSTMRTQLECQL